MTTTSTPATGLLAWAEQFVADGIARFGTLDAFTDALAAYNATTTNTSGE